MNTRIDTWISVSRLSVLISLLAGFFLFLGLPAKTSLAQQQMRGPIVEPPIGTVVAFAGSIDKIPNNWMVCDGTRLSRSDPRYRTLYLTIGNSWGGDGTTYFYLPDLMGRFLRGVERDGSGNASATPRDPDRERRGAANPADQTNPGNSGNDVGSMQADAIQNHTHLDSGHNHAADVVVTHDLIAKLEGEEVASGTGARVQGNEGNGGFVKVNVTVRNQVGTANLGDPSASNAGTPRVSGETRPSNAYVYWIIRYR